MGSVMLVKKFGLLFLLISVSLLSTSYAGRRLSYANKLEEEAVAATYKGPEQLHHEDINSIHGRLLRVNTKDYGRYDPAPTFVKPPFKLIQN